MNLAANIKQHQAAQPNCGNCAKWTQHEDARMPDHGHCEKMSVGRYVHRLMICDFFPSRWSKKR